MTAPRIDTDIIIIIRITISLLQYYFTLLHLISSLDQDIKGAPTFQSNQTFILLLLLLLIVIVCYRVLWQDWLNSLSLLWCGQVDWISMGLAEAEEEVVHLYDGCPSFYVWRSRFQQNCCCCECTRGNMNWPIITRKDLLNCFEEELAVGWQQTEKERKKILS